MTNGCSIRLTQKMVDNNRIENGDGKGLNRRVGKGKGQEGGGAKTPRDRKGPKFWGKKISERKQ